MDLSHVKVKTMSKVLTSLYKLKIKIPWLKDTIILPEVKKYLFIFVVLVTSFDIFIIKEFYGLLTFSVFFLWLLVIRLYKLKEKHFVISVIILFVLVAFFHIISVPTVTEKAAIWAYLFLIIYAWNLAKLSK